MRVLVTRAQPAASRTAARLASLGHEAIIFPLFEIKDTSTEIPTNPFAAYIFTSSNAIEVLQERQWRPVNPDAQVFCVGEKTAQSASSLGFTHITHAQGGARKLAEKIICANLPASSNILYFTTPDRSFDLKSHLAPYELNIENLDIYRAEPIQFNADEFLTSFNETAPDVILCYSKRSAEQLADLINSTKIECRLKDIRLIAISEQAIGNLSQYHWNQTNVSPVANEEAMFHILDQ